MARILAIILLGIIVSAGVKWAFFPKKKEDDISEEKTQSLIGKYKMTILSKLKHCNLSLEGKKALEEEKEKLQEQLDSINQLDNKTKNTEEG